MGADYWVPHPDGQGLIQNEPKETKGKGRYWISVNDWDSGTPGGDDLKKCPNGFPGPPTYGNFAVAGNNTAKLLAKNGHEVTLAYGLNACHTDAKIVHGHAPDAIRW